ncbi:P-loop containing nucleoside triphosphate hydrolase superfamily protein [Forsythia ovata]|uniref:P-loop containing nucleoside triphosphate hydrolase superfamily protein n=1 Tax=Forsythia ovata TaxID=205694 RepID=A0ABD1SMD6_9LAMI
MERIHVSVRARPLSSEDAKTSPWRISGNSIFIPNQPSKFEFDRIFEEECKTADVYKARTRDIVAAAVRGFNGTVFAYGQTSSGKTHTMRGSALEPGVIPLAVYDLFNIIHEEMDREFLLRMSYMEIYNEEINDLLAPEHRKLQIHESLDRGIFVAGLREEIVASPDQVLELMEFGESHRHIGETNMNVYSSRSHTIFRMIIESREKTDDTQADLSCDAVRVSVLNLVDLAGSERAAKTGAEGVRLKEGSHINKSLMTLGTVIKKLSEGAESQGGHVPYRDSKLTRILQPALGGNANTAIICNITLAQIHADETKSSLQFSSRALRVTNCAHVNEILTDAALLKRQKKEIEELRDKLQGLHSEHLEEEILNLRNTLLKSELERERMALELEEEKKAQAEREKRLQEQAKKIENLSSMVFCTNRDEIREVNKKGKRRDTWCPGNLARETLKELHTTVKEMPSVVNSTRADCKVGPLLPFEELINEVSMVDSSKQEADCEKNVVEDCSLPDPCALLHVTSRRKAPPKKRSLQMENSELAEMQTEYGNLLLKFETHRTMSDIQIDYLTRKLAEADLYVDGKYKDSSARNTNDISLPDENKSLRESDAILVIKQLQEKIDILEMEKSSSQQNLDSVVELVTEQTISSQEKFEKLYEELLVAREEATVACEQLASVRTSMEESDCLIKLSTEAQEIVLEVENSRHLIGSIYSVVEELFHCFSTMSKLLVDLRPSVSESSLQIKLIMRSHEKLQSFLRNKVRELEDEKLLLYNQASDLQCQIEELSLKVQTSANAFAELNENHGMQTSEFLSQIRILQNEISSLSSCSLAKEKESLRKDLEKTKAKLKDTEFKLKNAVQEKTKLEGEKACAEREIKLLFGQKAVLERDMSKRDSVVGRRRDSVIDRSSNAFEHKRTKGLSPLAEQELQEDYKRLEVLAFEMEATIASLEEQLAIAHGEKDVATSRSESLASDLKELSDELYDSNSKLSTLTEEVSALSTTLEESELQRQKVESSLSSLLEEKEELSMQLAEALLTMEEEKALWSSKERASVKAIEEKAKSYHSEIALLSKELSEVKDELEICRRECKDLDVRLTISEENANLEKQCSSEKSSEIDRLRNELRVADDDNKMSQELLKLKHKLEEQSGKLASLEVKMQNDQINYNMEKAKLRMRLKGAQTKLDTFRIRYKESVDELDYMNRKYDEASTVLKKQLASYGIEVLNLKKQLAAVKGQ